jgi:hypothetical protein
VVWEDGGGDFASYPMGPFEAAAVGQENAKRFFSPVVRERE